MCACVCVFEKNHFIMYNISKLSGHIVGRHSGLLQVSTHSVLSVDSDLLVVAVGVFFSMKKSVN